MVNIAIPKAIYRFSTIPIKILVAFSLFKKKALFFRIRVLKFVWKILRKEQRGGGITVADLNYTTKL